MVTGKFMQLTHAAVQSQTAAQLQAAHNDYGDLLRQGAQLRDVQWAPSDDVVTITTTNTGAGAWQYYGYGTHSLKAGTFQTAQPTYGIPAVGPAQPDSALAWLDRRVNEMRVKL